MDPVKPDRAQPGLTLRAERAEVTRNRIVTAARRLFARDGYGATTLRDVAAALALSFPEGTADRELLQGIVFGVVLFTLLVQGTTAGRVLRWAGVGTDENVREGEGPPE